MSVDTLAHAKAQLVSLLGSIDGVDAVYDHLRPYSTLAGANSLCVFTAGQDPNFWLLAVRLFLANNTDPKLSQDTLDTVLPLIDAATNDGHFGPTGWSVEYPTGDPWVIVATCVYQVGRTDV